MHDADFCATENAFFYLKAGLFVSRFSKNCFFLQLLNMKIFFRCDSLTLHEQCLLVAEQVTV